MPHLAHDQTGGFLVTPEIRFVLTLFELGQFRAQGGIVKDPP